MWILSLICLLVALTCVGYMLLLLVVFLWFCLFFVLWFMFAIVVRSWAAPGSAGAASWTGRCSCAPSPGPAGCPSATSISLLL